MRKANDKFNADLAALAAMSPTQLKVRWVNVEGPVSPALPAPLVRRLLAQRLQERQFGGLSATVVRELERAGRVEAVTSPRQSVPLTAGARLVRDWNGQTISVEVRSDGFWWRDQLWRSLSEIAGEVTGAHWSGPRFFGLNRRG